MQRSDHGNAVLDTDYGRENTWGHKSFGKAAMRTEVRNQDQLDIRLMMHAHDT